VCVSGALSCKDDRCTYDDDDGRTNNGLELVDSSIDSQTQTTDNDSRHGSRGWQWSVRGGRPGQWRGG